MNRMALGLAIGAGYVLGRTRKAKMALAVGSLVAGKRMNLSPKAVGELVSKQLLANPEFKEIGDQLRQDLSGVGKAASGAMVERQLDSLANRLHGRTAQVRDQLAGVAPDVPGTSRGDDEESDEPRDEDEPRDDESRGDKSRDDEDAPEAEDESRRREKAAGKKAARKAPANKASAKKGEAKRTAGAGKPAAKKTSGARRTAEGARSRVSKGSGER